MLSGAEKGADLGRRDSGEPAGLLRRISGEQEDLPGESSRGVVVPGLADLDHMALQVLDPRVGGIDVRESPLVDVGQHQIDLARDRIGLEVLGTVPAGHADDVTGHPGVEHHVGLRGGSIAQDSRGVARISHPLRVGRSGVDRPVSEYRLYEARQRLYDHLMFPEAIAGAHSARPPIELPTPTRPYGHSPSRTVPQSTRPMPPAP